jgi:transposase
MPKAVIVHPKIHVSQYLSEAVDKVRRQKHKDLMAQGDETLRTQASASGSGHRAEK